MTEEIEKLQRSIRKGKKKPTPAGVLVTGRLGKFRAPRLGHDGHLWVTLKAKLDERWPSGWVQGARCIVCDVTVSGMDSSWWIERASTERVREARRICRSESVRLQETYQKLSRVLKKREEKQ